MEIAVEAGEEVAHGVDVRVTDWASGGGRGRDWGKDGGGVWSGKNWESGGGRRLKRSRLGAGAAGQSGWEGASGVLRNGSIATLNERRPRAARWESDDEDTSTLAPSAGCHHDPRGTAVCQTDDACGWIVCAAMAAGLIGEAITDDPLAGVHACFPPQQPPPIGPVQSRRLAGATARPS
jgi:hypothetical protein